MSRNTVKVCVRTRPTQNFAQDNLFIDIEHATIMVKNNEPEGDTIILNNRQNTFKFRFDHVFHNASQTAVYDLYARDTVHDVVYGINGAILTYGQTGSGKTFTMLGDAASYEHRGVAPRAINQLFQEINSRMELEFLISCTYMEIYNERIYDLLVDVSHPAEVGSEFTIVEEKDGRGIIVRGLTEMEVRDEASALNLLFTGGLARTMATHKLNKRSNRSHSLFTLYLQQRQRSGVSERVGHSKLHLVDLAGSERLKKTMGNVDGSSLNMNDEITRKESMAINRSLTYLEQCVVALTRRSNNNNTAGGAGGGGGGSTGHIPYRQSKLTNILKDCLGANCNTLMLACIWGENYHLEETISTLRLASRMMKVTNESISIESIDPSILLKKQEKQIKALKQELLMHDALVERTGMVYDAYTPEQQAEMSQLIEKYVAAPEREEEDGILPIHTYRAMLEICKQFKKKLIDARQSMNSLQLGRYQAATSAVGSAGDGGDAKGGLDGTTGGGLVADGKGGAASMMGGGMFEGKPAKEVGNIVGQGKGFALGDAKMDSRPLNGIETAASYASYAPPKSPLSSSLAAGGGGGFGGGGGAGGGATGGRSDSKGSSMMMNSPPRGRGGVDHRKAGASFSPDKFDSLLGGGVGTGGGRGGGGGGGDSAMRASLEGFVKADEQGQVLFTNYSQVKNKLKESKNKVRALIMEVNGAKVDIDRLAQDLEARKVNRMQSNSNNKKSDAKKGNSDEGIVDEEEMRIARDMKECKQRYRNSFEQLQKQQANVTNYTSEQESLKNELLSQWQLWNSNNNAVNRWAADETNNEGEGGGDMDELDDAEAFDKLETERVMANDPDSLAFFSAQKTKRANLTQSGGSIKMLQRNKRFA